jgi:hypothetical protein
MKIFCAWLCLGLLLAGLLSGCSTYGSRSREKAAAFAALDAGTQMRLKERRIQVGDTEDMVYIALGRADERRGSLDALGNSAVWIYVNRWDEYRGTVVTGYNRHTVTDPKTGKTTVSIEPITEPVYERRTEERLRIYFTSGLVNAVEELAVR